MNIIIAGCGRVGQNLADTLTKSGHEVTVMDKDYDALASVTGSVDVIGYQGDCTSVKSQLEAGVKNADLLIAVTNIDEINMFEYDSSKIHPLNFYFFVFVTGLKETDFFEEFKVLIDSLEKEYPKFATYFWNKEIKYPVGETLVKIFED